jgi:hypothetical protein
MRVVLHLNDDVGDFYEKEAANRDRPIESILEGRLTRSTLLDPRHRYVILVGDSLARVESATTKLPLSTPEAVASAVERVARVQFGDHRLELTPGQLEEIAWRAHKQGKTISEMLALAFAAFSEQFFTLVP